MPGIKVDTGRSRWRCTRRDASPRASTGCASGSPSTTRSVARFAKWRAVITIGDGIPTDACIEANAHALARYAALCQEAGIVPIVEPEVLMDADNTIERCDDVTGRTLRALYAALYEQRRRTSRARC